MGHILQCTSCVRGDGRPQISNDPLLSTFSTLPHAHCVSTQWTVMPLSSSCNRRAGGSSSLRNFPMETSDCLWLPYKKWHSSSSLRGHMLQMKITFLVVWLSFMSLFLPLFALLLRAEGRLMGDVISGASQVKSCTAAARALYTSFTDGWGQLKFKDANWLWVCSKLDCSCPKNFWSSSDRFS